MVKKHKYRYTRRKSIKKFVIFTCVFLCVSASVFFQTRLFERFQYYGNKIIQITDAYVKMVTITGASPKVEKLIRANLGIKTGDSIFSTSTIKMLNNLSNIGWIKEVTIHKILPNIIKIKIKERIPIAVYYHNHKYNLIDAEGVLIEQVNSNPGLPLVSGENANLKINDMLNTLNKYPNIKVYSLAYVQNRRWNLILDNKVTVKLPCENITNALETLSIIISRKNILNSVTAIDLRINGNVIMSGLKRKSI